MSDVKTYLEIPDDADITLVNPLKSMRERQAKKKDALKRSVSNTHAEAAKYVANTVYNMAHRKHFS